MRISIHSRQSAGAFLGVLLLIVVAVFLIGLFTLISRASRLKPRTLPAEDTNSFYHEYRPDIYFASVPQQPNPNPPALKAKSAAIAYTCHTNTVTFEYNEATSNGWVVILRSEDFVHWTVLEHVLFEEPRFTNSVASMKFVDLYAPSAGAFYKGLVILNR